MNLKKIWKTFDLKHNKRYYAKFFLTFVLLFFIVTYITVNKDTIDEQIVVIGEGSTFFAKLATYEILNIEEPVTYGVESNSETYRIEEYIFEQINEIRVEKGVLPLQWDPLLAKLAREHSMDMAQADYFGHENLFGLGPNERARELGIKTIIEVNGEAYEGIGENIGLMPKGVVQDVGVLITAEDVASAMNLKWMLSEPHKENILYEDYFYTGVGVVYNGQGQYYITQNFQ